MNVVLIVAAHCEGEINISLCDKSIRIHDQIGRALRCWPTAADPDRPGPRTDGWKAPAEADLIILPRQLLHPQALRTARQAANADERAIARGNIKGIAAQRQGRRGLQRGEVNLQMPALIRPGRDQCSGRRPIQKSYGAILAEHRPRCENAAGHCFFLEQGQIPVQKEPSRSCAAVD